MEKYLKSKEYYEDLYDRHTVDSCRSLESIYNKSIKDKVSKKMTNKDHINLAAHKMAIYFETGERYVDKEETINKWIVGDEAKDKLLENTVPPENIYCNECGEAMLVEDKMLHTHFMEKEEKILFLFSCPAGCGKRRAVFNDSEEWTPKPELCDKCKARLDKETEKQGDKIIINYSCVDCNFKKTDKLDLSIKKPRKKIDKFFNRDKARFCLNKKQGEEYIDGRMRLKELDKIMKRDKEKEKNKEIYDKASKLKRLTIVELEKILISTLKKKGYIKFELEKPEMGKDVFIKFSVRDEKSNREEHQSTKELKNLINTTLKNTTWRLMSEGISYRLGFLTGRLRAYEREEDLIKLVK